MQGCKYLQVFIFLIFFLRNFIIADKGQRSEIRMRMMADTLMFLKITRVGIYIHESY